jgi:hypothetical protein
MRSFVVVLSFILLAPGAFAAVPAESKREARRAAVLHLQVEVRDISESCLAIRMGRVLWGPSSLAPERTAAVHLVLTLSMPID